MEHDRNQEPATPNQSANMEPAEGSRENVRDSGGEPERGHRESGITNRGLDREFDEQSQLPERGRSKSDMSSDSER
jgi:hypothetical protein